MDKEEKDVVISVVFNALQSALEDPRLNDDDTEWFKFHCRNEKEASALLIELDRFAKLVLDHDNFIHVKIEDCVVLLNKETNLKTEKEILKWNKENLKRRIQNGI